MFTNFTSAATRAVVGAFGTALCAGICLVGATAPAHAETVSRVVRTADLNLASVAGQKALNHRIAVAAREVCTSTSRDLATKVEESRCLRRAVADATVKATLAIRIVPAIAG